MRRLNNVIGWPSLLSAGGWWRRVVGSYSLTIGSNQT